jgi:hypothetical protein
MATTDATRTGMLAQSRWLGADAALTAVSWVIMSGSDAASLLGDADPAAMDRYREPDLSGEFADDLTPDSLAEQVGLTRDELCICPDEAELRDALADAWEEGRDLVWGNALQAVALRILGHVDQAARVETDAERTVERLRVESESHDWWGARP